MLTQHSGFAAYLGWRGLYLDAPPFTIETCPPSGRRRLDPWGRREWGASIAALTFARSLNFYDTGGTLVARNVTPGSR